MRAPDPASVAVSYPSAASGDFATSGFARGAEELYGTAAVVDEPLGAGRVTVFAGEPNFRAYTTGTQKLLRNAVLGRDLAGPGTRANTWARTAERSRSAASVDELSPLRRPVRLTVRATDEAATRSLLDRYGLRYEVRTAAGLARIAVANPAEAGPDQLPWLDPLVRELRAGPIKVVALIAR